MPILKTIQTIKEKNRWKQDPYYNSTVWKRLRKLKLNRNPLCEICENHGILKEGNTIDHHFPRRFWPEHQNKVENLTTMCQSHHNQKSQLEMDCNNKMQWMAKIKKSIFNK